VNDWKFFQNFPPSSGLTPMKITISSPDGLGDFILRIPMLRALEQAGHSLQIFLRRPALDLAADSFPEAQLHEIEADPYHPDTRREKRPFRESQRAMKAFAPDMYVGAAFSGSFFDEVWLEQKNRPGRVIGFVADHGSGGVASKSADPQDVHVPISLPELEKNRLLASAILGQEMAPRNPTLKPTLAALDLAGSFLAEHGLKAGSFWIACVGSRYGLRMKDWGEENWAQLFSTINDGTPVVFFGNTKESESIDRIRASLAQKTINTAQAPLPMPLVLALLAQSRGYVGRDSGIMHMAAASGRRVFALFGGGHWGRFLPSGAGVVVTARVPCRGCDFVCPHERVHCIRDVSLPFAVEAWKAFLQESQELIVREESLAPELLERLRAKSSAHLIAEQERVSREQRIGRQTWLLRMKTFFLSRIRPA